MKKKSVRTSNPELYLVPTAIGIVIGGALRVLGTPLLVLLLAAGIATAYALGWRAIITRKDTDQITDR